MKTASKRLLTVLAGLILSGWCHAQPTQLGIDRNAGPARITVQGETNRDYTVQASDLSATNWTFLSTLSLSNSSQTWFDAASAAMPARFYRAMKLDTNEYGGQVFEYADDFRLTDHQGISRSLYYYDYTISTNVKAFVLIFTGNGCENVQQMAATIKSLRNQFTPKGVTFWMIDANLADNRSNIVAEAASLGITNIPILHDRAQLVARAYHAAATPEAVCVSTLGWRIFYRGAIDDRIGSNTVSTTQHYLSNALSSFLAGGTVTPRQTQTQGCDVTLAPIPTPAYATEIAPLLLDKCVRCHSPGNIAPFAMTDYDEVQFQALSMRSEILAGRMPPWHADPFYQSFTNDISLTPTQAARLVQWIDDGAPRGSGPDPLTNAPPQTNYPFAWPAALGTPDIIIPVGNQPIPASGTIDYRYVYHTYTGTDVWLRAAVILPGTVPVVHHLGAALGAANLGETFLTLYVPGADLGAFPAGTSRRLTNGTTIAFQIHYIAIGEATNDASLLGLYTTPIAPAYPLIQTWAPSLGFAIPPNKNEYQYVTTSLRFTTNVWLHQVYPHMHTRGSRFKYEAIYPVGHNPASEILLSVPYYNFHWQTTYRFAEPKYLPKNTYLKCTATWDNSVMNKELMEVFTDPDNPNNFQYDPKFTVYLGEQTWNEMGIGYFDYSQAP